MDERLKVAMGLATEWHLGELRNYTTDVPYITHPIAVANLLAEISGSWELIAAGYLHDTLECPEEIRIQRERVILDLLGPGVLQLVKEVTNPSRMNDGSRAVRKAIDRQHLSKASPDGQSLRLADAIHNFSDLQERSPAFALTYAGEKKLILPLTTQGSPVLHERLSQMIENILAG